MQHFSLIKRLFLLLLITQSLPACSTLGYYSQSVRGQIAVMSKRVPISDLIADEHTPPQKKALLENILQIREFASKQLLLPDNRSYNTYVDLDRKYVVWNVFAAPEFSLEPLRSCFVFVGCLQYRGFFAKQDAIDFAQTLRNSNYDVFVGGVAAYSTLGWFDDPVLSSMLTYGEFRLAEVIFHELAHQLIYVKDDTAFNEAFATAVGEVGVRRWLTASKRKTDLKKYNLDKHWDYDFLQLILGTRKELDSLYNSNLLPEQKRHAKKKILEQLRKTYYAMKTNWDDPPDYDNWIENDLNNAKIASVVTYYDLVSSFVDLLSDSGGDLSLFYDRVKYLGTLPTETRRHCLENINQNPGCYPHKRSFAKLFP